MTIDFFQERTTPLILASTRTIPRSGLTALSFLEQINQEDLKVSCIDLPEYSSKKNSFYYYLYLIRLEELETDLRRQKRFLSRKSKRGWRRNRHIIKLKNQKIRELKDSFSPDL